MCETLTGGKQEQRLQRDLQSYQTTLNVVLVTKCLFFFFFLFKVESVAYGSTQVRRQIGAAAYVTASVTATLDPEPTE